MTEIEIHQREKDDNTESFLQENIGQYKNDAEFLWKQMLRGEVLTAKIVVQKYGKEPRRLRDLEISGKCKKRWKLNDAGKRLFVEFYCEIPKPPTKSDLQQWFSEYQDGKHEPKQTVKSTLF